MKTQKIFLLGFLYPHIYTAFPLVFFIAVCQHIDMVCIYCSGSTSVSNSRHVSSSNNVWRRRQCKVCLAVFTTNETVDESRAIVVIKNGSYKPFLRDKLFLSINSSLLHRKTVLTDATSLTATLCETVIAKATNGLVESRIIALEAQRTLERFDRVAASHYEAFHQEAFRNKL